MGIQFQKRLNLLFFDITLRPALGHYPKGIGYSFLCGIAARM
jgi:hypothetical protein